MPSFVQAKAGAVGASQASSFTVTLTQPVAGNSLVALIDSGSVAISSVASTGASWTYVTTGVGRNTDLEVWIASVLTGTPGTVVTITAASTTFMGAAIFEVSGAIDVDGTPAFGGSATSVTSATTGAVTTTTTASLLLASVHVNGVSSGGTATAPYTLGATNSQFGQHIVSGYYAPGSIVSGQTATLGWSGSSGYDTIHVAVKAHVSSTPISGSDSETQTLTESAVTSATTSSSDSQTQTLTSTTATAFSDGESETQSVTETQNVTLGAAGSDSQTQTIVESGAPPGATVSGADSETQTLTETTATSATTSAADSQTQTLTSTTAIGLSQAEVETQALSEASAIGLSGAESQTQALTSSTSTGLAGAESQTQALTSTASTTATTSSSETQTQALTEATQLAVAPTAYHQRIRFDVFDSSGTKVGPLVHLLTCSYSESLDKLGQYTFSTPSTDPQAAVVVDGYETRLYREGEGELFRGIVRAPQDTVSAEGSLVRDVQGDATAKRLVWANTRLRRNYDGVAPATALADLLSGTGWTVGHVDTTATLLSAQYNGVTILSAILDVAKRFGWHARFNTLTATVDLGDFGASSGIVLQNVRRTSSDLTVVPITSIGIARTQQDYWTRIFPLGAGQGVNALDLRYSTRTTPYTIHSLTGPDGTTQYYLDTGATPTRETVIQFPDVQPLANSNAELTNAANALYDLAAAWLQWASVVPETYTVEVVGLTHVAAGVPRFRVGDTFRLVYRGFIVDENGARVWKDVNADVWLLGYTRSFDATGADKWQLTISTSDRTDNGAAATIAQAVQNLWSIQTALRPVTYREIHGPAKRSIDSTHPVTFPVNYDTWITYLHHATLDVSLLAVVANASGASGGTAHSHSVSGQSANSGGGQTSGGGSSHSHTVTATSTDNQSVQHDHVMFAMQPTAAWSTPTYNRQVLSTNDAGSQIAWFVDEFSADASTENAHTWASGGLTHNHPIQAQTTASEATHTHAVSAHTHTITTTTATNESTHTHGLNYGIYQGPNPTGANIHVLINGADVTTALGGPWSADFSVDVTAYLQDSQGRVLRQKNTIQVQTSAAVHDVELTCRSLVTATTLVPA